MNLKGKDLFLLSRIIKKIGLKDKLPNVINVTGKTEEEKEIIKEEQGRKLMIEVIENIYLAEGEIIDLLSRASGRTIKEVEELDFEEFIELVKTLFNGEEFKSFFK